MQPSAGHYISDVFSASEHSWKTYNDSMVFDVREEEVRQRRQTTGYIFFYMHK
jgi:ubiquitin carboxyl-terminal hydrolase 26/29/37